MDVGYTDAAPAGASPALDDDLFREIILDHYRNPRHRGELDPADVTIEGSNPLCGDEISLSLRTRQGAVDGVGFTGRGCSISQASASMMCEAVSGRSLEETAELIRRFKSMMVGEGSGDELGDLEALQGVRRYAVRVKCAVLPWNALLQGLGAETDQPEERFSTARGSPR